MRKLALSSRRICAGARKSVLGPLFASECTAADLGGRRPGSLGNDGVRKYALGACAATGSVVCFTRRYSIPKFPLQQTSKVGATAVPVSESP